MRHVWFAAVAAGVLTCGTVAGATEITSDCDQLEFRMQMSKTADKRASCTASVTSVSGERVTKTFTGFKKTLPAIDSKGAATEAVIIGESCAACGEDKLYKFGVNDFAKIAEYARASVRNEAEAMDENAAVQAEIEAGVKSCLTDRLGRPLKTSPTKLLECRIITMQNLGTPDEAIAYYRRWIQPALRSLVASEDPAARDLGRRAVLTLGRIAEGEPRITEALKDVGHFLFYRDQVEQAAWAIKAAGPSAPARTAEVARLGQIQRQWTSTYGQRRELLKRQGVLSPELEESSRAMESALNKMYGAFGAEIKEAQGASSAGTPAQPGQGRTMFGQPGAAPRPVGPSAPVEAPRPGSAPAGASRIFRPN